MLYADNLPMLSSWMEGESSSDLIVSLSSDGKSDLILGAGMAFGIVTNTISAKRRAAFIVESDYDYL